MQTNYQHNCDLPSELCARPLALVGISGLDTLNNAIHKSIWEAFNSLKRTDKSSVLYKLIENDHEFPVIKPRRNSYDWYVPKGILKKNWMRKHLYEVPAVIAIFYDLDWNESSWSEKMIECASRVQSMRAALEARNTRILLVLIQNALPMPPGEDVQATERAVSICASCELQSNSLFVLPQGDHLHGYTLRLESAFLEFAQNYYHNEIRNIKSHKEHLNKNTHQYLFVRHQFKLGFLYELKQDIHTAHKHYTHSYNSLLEIRIVDTNALEIRTIAGFINYKLCKLLFALNLPRDAIAHFKAHIDKFKQRIGFQELAFEHYAWLSKQFSVFGDVFDAAVKLGITPVQTQHPGIYYQQAAEYAIMRKNFAQEVCSKVASYPLNDPFDITQNVDFYGQRPWKSTKPSMDPLDPDLESRGIQALQYLEKQVNHSNIIISLYGLAIQQHKIYKCPRTRRYLVIQMAEEYYKSGDFGKCLTLLTHMLYDLRSEKWWQLLTDILSRAFQCAFLTANVPDYLSLGLELLGKNTTLTNDQKKVIYNNITRIFSAQLPFGDLTLQQDVFENAIVQWQHAFNKIPVNVNLDMGNIVSCIEAKAKFTSSFFEMDDKVRIDIFVRNVSTFELNFIKITVTLSTSSTPLELPVAEESFDFAPEQSKRYFIEFKPKHEHVNKYLQIASLNLTMGDPQFYTAELKFSNSLYENGICHELLHFQLNKNAESFIVTESNLKTFVLPRRSRMNIEIKHDSPALQGEWYEIVAHITSEEDCSLVNLKIEASLTEDVQIEGLEFSRHPSGSVEKLPMTLAEFETFDDKKITVKFFMKACRLLQQNVEVKVMYFLSEDPTVVCVKKETTKVIVTTPFSVTTKFLSLFMTELDQFYYGERFKILCVIENLSSWPLVIESSDIESDYQVDLIKGDYREKLENIVLNKGETYVDIFPAISMQVSELSIVIGKYSIKWKRQNGYSTTNQITLSGYPVQWMPFQLSANVSAYGIVRQPLLITYNLYNNSDHLIHLSIYMDASEAFMFAGYKHILISVLPKTLKKVRYNLYPLVTGKVLLPKVTIKIPDSGPEDLYLSQDDIDALMRRSLPSHIYIMPQVKGNPQKVERQDRQVHVDVKIIED